MNLDSLAPILDFFSHGIGAIIAQISRVFFDLIYPSNAEGATNVVVPK